MRMRAVVTSVLAVGLVVGNGGFVAHADDSTPSPNLDVAAALTKLRDHQVYRAPGAVASIDTDLVKEELPDDVRLLIGPYRNPDYPDEEYTEEIHRPLDEWVRDHDVSLIQVQGLSVTSVVGPDGLGDESVPSELAGVQHTTAYGDVTTQVRALIAKLRGDADAADAVPEPEAVTSTPSDHEVDELAKRLRDERIYNAAGRDDDIALPLDEFEEEIGVTVRIAAFPERAEGEPLVEYAPALAERFPDDLIFVVHGRWLDVAGGDEDKLVSARNYAFGRSIRVALRQFVPTSRMLLNVLGRYDTLHSQHPFSRPQPVPFDLGRTIATFAPWLLGGSALLLGGIPLVRWWRGRATARAAERAALRQQQARTHSEIVELGSRVYAETAATELRTAAAERYETARDLFDEAHTAEAMQQVRGVVAEGVELLDRARQETR